MNWLDVKLGDVAPAESGFGFPREFQGRQEGSIAFYKVGDMNHPANQREMVVSGNYVDRVTLKRLRAKSFPPGTIIFPKIGAAIATGKKRMLSSEATYDNNVMGLVPTALVHPSYLYYWTILFDFTTISNKGPVPSIRKSEIESLPFRLPTPSEQRRIVDVLDQADALRRRRRAADERAQRILPALFHKLFGDPVANSKNWPLEVLDEPTADFHYGTSARCEKSSDGLPVLRIPNIVRGELDLGDLKFAQLPHNEVEALRLEKGDILFVRTNGNPDYVGRCAVFDLEQQYLFASYLIRGRFNPAKFSPYYLVACLSSPGGRRMMAPAIRTTAGQSNISATGLRRIQVPCPPLELQAVFAEQLLDIAQRTKAQRVVGGKLDLLSAVLLHRAFTGELTAKWREAHKDQLEVEMQQQLAALERVKAVKPERGRKSKKVTTES